MNGDRIAMSARERDRLKVMAPVLEGQRTQAEAARLMILCERQVRRVLRRYEAEGDAGLVHRARGRPSNRRLPEALRRRVMAQVAKTYRDFGPTLAAEKIQERDGLAVSRETLRQWMTSEGLWKPRSPRGRCTCGVRGGRLSGNWCRWTRASTPA